jgi:hypothetical protein
MTQAAAATGITGAGLVLGTVSMQSSATVAAGLVVSESPVAKTSVAEKSAVSLVVSSGSAASQSMVQGIAFVSGPVSGGNITAFQVSGGAPGTALGTAVTSATGSYTIILGTYSGSVVLSLSKGSFTNAATGATSTFGGTLRAAVASVSGAVTANITPITEAAVIDALSDSGGLTADNIEAEEKAAINLFGFDPVGIAPASALTVPLNYTPTPSVFYGAYLGGVSQFLIDNPSATMTAATADLAAQIKAGYLDANTSLSLSMSNFLANNPNNQTGLLALTELQLDAAAISNPTSSSFPTPSYADLVTLPSESPAEGANDVTVTSTLNGTPVLGVRPLPAPNETFDTYAGETFELNHPCGILYMKESGGETSWNTLDCGVLQSGFGGEYVANGDNCVDTLVLFKNWSGACTGSGDCSFTVPTPLNANSTGVSVVANFVSQQVSGVCSNMPPFTLTTSTVTTPPIYVPPDPAPGLPNSIHVVLTSTYAYCYDYVLPACGKGGSFTIAGIAGPDVWNETFSLQGSVDGVSFSSADGARIPDTLAVDCYLIQGSAMTSNGSSVNFQGSFGPGCNTSITSDNSFDNWGFDTPSGQDSGTLTAN